ncbi:MAG: hypothetical protein GWO20_09915 [Candidatus Korarchaeota archaeon]|nr:hypothetical protein [Candidatus Korarchaeota archaeon]NIU83795.1 hypothetical protein [Candidatus Thorarchaeota archaeon]NIW13979.1 hypothetical protein [Candidatus Thorarchaeota archaeon]NIW52116.1 hypothetical protein [Candidatus Korarchaeota archaeon]
MISRKKKGKNIFFSCEECGFTYETEELARKCEQWCSEHNSCNMEITSHAIEVGEEEEDWIEEQ